MREIRPGIYLDDSIVDELVYCNSIIFDCDGVLVDVRESYYSAIRHTVKHVLETVAGIRLVAKIDAHLIEKFKATGGFNNEVDLAYALVLCVVAAERLGMEQKKFIARALAHSDSTGLRSTESYIEGIIGITDTQVLLIYPEGRSESPMCRVFDQLFYGPKLYRELFGRDSEFAGPGFISRDRLLVDAGLLDWLNYWFDSRVAMVTGRGMRPARYTLGKLIYKFDLASSEFLEDESRSNAKPNPKPLIRCMKEMVSRGCIYVGDSVEDYMMVQNAAELGMPGVFCGIIGTAASPQRKLDLFEGMGVQVAVNSIKLLPELLGMFSDGPS